MNKATFLVIVLISTVSSSVFGQNRPITEANYKLPARFSPDKLKKMVFSTSVDPHWLKLSDRFWYTFETTKGKLFYIVDPGRKIKKLMFDNTTMASKLTELTQDPYDAKHLPINKIKFVDKEQSIRFMVESSQEALPDTSKAKKEKSSPPKKKKKKNYFLYNLSSKNLTLLKDYKEPAKKPKWASISPDGKTILFSKHYNLFWMDKENYKKALKDEKDSTITEHALTTDGVEFYSYGGSGWGINNVDKEKNKDKRKFAYIIWSRDSRKFAINRTDMRKVKDLWVINSLSTPRPTLETYKYQMPGEKESPIDEILIFSMDPNPENRKPDQQIKVKADAFKDQTLSIITAPRIAKNRDDENRPALWLSKTNDKLYFTRSSRDLKRIDVCVADPENGETKKLIEERMNTYVETRRLGLVNNGKELIEWSERDGWAHFYLYDQDGNLKNRITSGPFHCEDIVRIDQKNRILYFTANDKESEEDPYYLHFYRVNFDGSGLKLLNKGNFNHFVSMDDNHRFFVDNYSRVNTIPQSQLYDNQGNNLLDLEKADLSLLFEAGYHFPEPFHVKADDGLTDLYGVMYKPFDFDSSKLYPIIEYVYPGPQTEAVNKSFSTRMDRVDRLAQFGFIVITVGNRGGHPSRSKWYHNYGYGNLRDYGLADKKAVVEQLAARHPFIDIDKVGIFGHSGGGFMSTAAMLVYPDFFKVAVSSSGNHENNIYNRWWSEKHHGVKEVTEDNGKIKFEYHIDKNSEIAKNLKGHLLITTGDIDNNVHPGNTIRLANALIKANKRFDIFIFPGQRHGYGSMNEYFSWLRADYFCKYLIGYTPKSVDIIEINRDKAMTK